MAERTSVLSILGRPTPIDTIRPFRPIPNRSGESLLGGIRAGIGGVADIDALRTNRELRKRKLRDMDMEFEKQQQAMDVVRNSIELDPRTGSPSINRSKLVNGMIQVDPERGVQLMQALTQHDLQQAQINAARLERERQQLKAPLERQKLEAEISAQRAGPTGKTLEERAAAGDPIAQEGLRLRETRRAKERRAQQEGLVSAVSGREFAKERARREFDQDLTVGERIKDIGLFIDTETGDPVDQSLTVREFREGQRSKEFRKMTPKQFDRLQSTKSLLPLMQSMGDDLRTIYGPGGIFERLEASGRFRAGVKGALAKAFQTDPELVAIQRKVKGNIDLIRRNFQGQVGTQTERDAERGLVTLPVLSGLPDTKDVAFDTFDSLTNIINSMLGTMVGNKAFQAPELAPLEDMSMQPQPAMQAESPEMAALRKEFKDAGGTDAEFDAGIGLAPMGRQ